MTPSVCVLSLDARQRRQAPIRLPFTASMPLGSTGDTSRQPWQEQKARQRSRSQPFGLSFRFVRQEPAPLDLESNYFFRHEQSLRWNMLHNSPAHRKCLAVRFDTSAPRQLSPNRRTCPRGDGICHLRVRRHRCVGHVELRLGRRRIGQNLLCARHFVRRSVGDDQELV
jgi:hypothetical protein